MRPPYPPDYPPHPFDEPASLRPAMNRLGLLLFLASLVMLFGSSMIGYLVIRFTGDSAPAPGWMHLPVGLWVSTALLVASAWTMHGAQRAGGAKSLDAMRRFLHATLVLAVAFIAVQLPCLLSLVRSHDVAATQNIGLYGLVFCLIVIHALHVAGGLVPLGWLTYKSRRGRLSLADVPGVRTTALYWHFLDAVWLIMFAVFILAG